MHTCMQPVQASWSILMVIIFIQLYKVCVLSKRLKERHCLNNVRTEDGYNFDNGNWDRETLHITAANWQNLTGRNNCIFNIVISPRMGPIL